MIESTFNNFARCPWVAKNVLKALNPCKVKHLRSCKVHAAVNVASAHGVFPSRNPDQGPSARPFAGPYASSASPPPPSKLAVVLGATGGVGQLIALRLLEEGFTVFASCRCKKKAQRTLGPETDRLRHFSCDTARPETLRALFASLPAGSKPAVVCATGTAAFASSKWGPGAVNNPKTVDREGVRNAVDAARGAGTVSRFVLVSSAGTERVFRAPADHPVLKILGIAPPSLETPSLSADPAPIPGLLDLALSAPSSSAAATAMNAAATTSVALTAITAVKAASAQPTLTYAGFSAAGAAARGADAGPAPESPEQAPKSGGWGPWGLSLPFLPSSSKPSLSSNFLPYVLMNAPAGVLEHKRAGEDYLRTSRLPYTIVRPGRLCGGGAPAADLVGHGVAARSLRTLTHRRITLSREDNLDGCATRVAVAELVVQALASEAATYKAISIECGAGGKKGPGRSPVAWEKLFRAM